MCTGFQQQQQTRAFVPADILEYCSNSNESQGSSSCSESLESRVSDSHDCCSENIPEVTQECDENPHQGQRYESTRGKKARVHLVEEEEEEDASNGDANVAECDACPCCMDVCDNYRNCHQCSMKGFKAQCRPSHLSSPAQMQQFTMCQVRRHDSVDSLWLVAGGKVYDVTSYIDRHPGGRYGLLKYGGGRKDVTRDLQFHSKQGQRLWRTFHIGFVQECCSSSRGSNNSMSCHSLANGSSSTSMDQDGVNGRWLPFRGWW